MARQCLNNELKTTHKRKTWEKKDKFAAHCSLAAVKLTASLVGRPSIAQVQWRETRGAPSVSVFKHLLLGAEVQNHFSVFSNYLNVSCDFTKVCKITTTPIG